MGLGTVVFPAVDRDIGDTEQRPEGDLGQSEGGTDVANTFAGSACGHGNLLMAVD